MAVNCCVFPGAMLGLVGSIAMASRVALVTFKVIGPEMPPNVAVIVVLPAAAEVANPREATALLTVATPGLEELQVTDVVRFCVVLSE